MRAFLISVACITLIAFVGACGPDSRREDPVRQDMPKKFQKAKPEKEVIKKQKSSKRKRMSDRERYEAFVNARIQDHESRLEKMKLRVMHSSGRSKKLAKRNIKELQSEIYDARVQYNKLENAKGKNWATSKEQMDKSLGNMDAYSR